MRWRAVIELHDDPHQKLPFTQHQIAILLKQALTNLPLRVCSTIKSVTEVNRP